MNDGDMPPSGFCHRIMIIPDGWRSQVKGVVPHAGHDRLEPEAMGHVVDVIGPNRFRTIPCPTCPDKALSM
jgi:hypothetical protein